MMQQDEINPSPLTRGLTSPPVRKLQVLMTVFRYLLVLPAFGVVFFFTDRGPMWPGVVVVLAGEMIQLWASSHLRKNEALVTSGPYAYVRNPMYLGRFFVGLGLSLLTWRWYLIFPYMIIFWFYAQARVLGEEERLKRLFGDDYVSYYQSVHRWIPSRPKQRFSDERWSWACVLRNHELRVAALVLVGLALLKWRLFAFGLLWKI